MTRVTYGLHYTRNLGNFENVKVYYEISDDVRDGENVDTAFGRVVGKVDDLVENKVKEIDAEAVGK